MARSPRQTLRIKRKEYIRRPMQRRLELAYLTRHIIPKCLGPVGGLYDGPSMSSF